ncbi:uncharacterized protein LOC141686216 [Apium graveolens]|uniref:uncharacterized protein LOC141686216 n=1 Tax=Apium graveolens TaxID=4045 RepID=UPI003D79F5B5
MDVNKSKPGGSIGLSYHILTKNNYTTWAMKMKVYMQAQGVWVAIEPSDPKGAVEEKTDKVALAMIYQRLAEDMLLSIAEKSTSKEVWEALKIMCQGVDRVKKAKAQTLRTKFEFLSMRDNEQINEFYLRLNGLVSDIRALGDEMKEAYVVKKLLRVVPSRFLQIISTLQQFGDLETLSVEEVVGSLKAHEERIKGCNKSDSNEGQLLLTEEEWQKRELAENKLLLTRDDWLKKTNRRNSDGSSSNFRNRGGRDKSNLKCYNCGIYGHFAVDCRRPKRNREQREEVNMSKIEDDELALLLAKCDEEGSQTTLLSESKLILSQMTKLQGDPNVWFLDNGASSHMTGLKSKFTRLDEKITGVVSFGDGSSVRIEGK